MSKKSAVGKDVEDSIKALTEKRSLPFADKKEMKALPKGSLIKRCIRMMKMWMNRSSGRSWPGDDGRPLTRMCVIAVLLGACFAPWREKYLAIAYATAPREIAAIVLNILWQVLKSGWKTTT